MLDVQNIPDKMGVYIFKNDGGRILYVGKARSLKKRVGSYITPHTQDPKTQALVKNTADLEYILTDTETEALILEANLIKKHSPRYNVRFRDDKRYPYIKITCEDYPRILVARSVRKDGGRYYGPYTNSKGMRDLIRMTEKFFGVRSCRGDVLGKKPCLKYHIKRCAGPCAGDVGRGEYLRCVEEACMFLGGDTSGLLSEFRERMSEHSKNFEFERAALLRDKIKALEELSERQKMSYHRLRDTDALGYARDKNKAAVSVFSIRAGSMIAHSNYFLRGEYKNDKVEGLASFIKQYYGVHEIPARILVDERIPEKQALEEWLSAGRNGFVKIIQAKSKSDRDLVKLVAKNAGESLTQKAMAKPVEKLMEALGLDRAPGRIEGFDVSNIMGSSATASMVVFADGLPDKTEYRRYRIKTVSGADDVAMLREVAERRYSKPGVLPDLVLVDGGRAQLNAVSGVLRNLGVDVPVISLAKEHEEVYTTRRAKPITLPRSSEALKLLQRVRDEAHRFAVSYHRKLRSKKTLS